MNIFNLNMQDFQCQSVPVILAVQQHPVMLIDVEMGYLLSYYFSLL